MAVEKDTMTLEFGYESITWRQLVTLTKPYIPEGWFINWIDFSENRSKYIKTKHESPLSRVFEFPLVRVIKNG